VCLLVSDLSTAPELSLVRVTRSKLAETVAQQLLSELREKQPKPGTRIPSERELMSALGVGRSTIREAINGLAMLGVVETRHGQGAFVVDPFAGVEPPLAIGAALARGVTRDLFEARRLVEVHVARLAAERRTPADLRDIEQALIDHQTALTNGESAVDASVRLHVTVAIAAHNEILSSFVISFAHAMNERGPLLEDEPGFREWEIGQHRSVFEPIRDSDPDLAAERMRAHLDAVMRYHERIGLPPH
jgi:GntR family transcriptional repressor for pyruvate dehydrogenase complex